MIARLLLALAALAAAMPAAAQAGWWRSAEAEIDSDAGGCTLHRPEAATDRTRVALRLDTARRRTLILSGRHWRFEEGKTYRVRLTPVVDAREPPSPIEIAATGFLGERGWAGVRLSVTPEQEILLFSQRTLRVEDITGRPLRLGEVTTLFDVSRARIIQCYAEIGKADAGPATLAVAPPRLRGSSDSYMILDDYPAAAMRAEQEGRVDMRITVTAEGRVSNCVVTRSSSSVALDQVSCSLMRRRARFFPAVDAEGHPTEGVFDQSIEWTLPPTFRGQRVQ